MPPPSAPPSPLPWALLPVLLSLATGLAAPGPGPGQRLGRVARARARALARPRRAPSSRRRPALAARSLPTPTPGRQEWPTPPTPLLEGGGPGGANGGAGGPEQLFPAVGDVARIPGQFAEELIIGQIKTLRFDKDSRKWKAVVEPLREFANGFFDVSRNSQWKAVDVEELVPVVAFYVQDRASWKLWYRTKAEVTSSSSRVSEPIPLQEKYDLPAEPMFMPDVLTGRESQEDAKAKLQADFDKKLTQMINDAVQFKLPVIAETLLYGAFGAFYWSQNQGDAAAQTYLTGVAAGIAYVVLLNDGGGPARIAIPALLIASLAKRNAALQGMSEWFGSEKTFGLVPKDQFLAAIIGFATHRLPLFRKGFTEFLSLLSDMNTSAGEFISAPVLNPIASAPRSRASVEKREASSVSSTGGFQSTRVNQNLLTGGRLNRKKSDGVRRRAIQQQESAAVAQALGEKLGDQQPLAMDNVEEGDEAELVEPLKLNVVRVTGVPGMDVNAVIAEMCAREPRLKQPVWVTDTETSGKFTRPAKAVRPVDFDALSQEGKFLVEETIPGEFGLPQRRFGLMYSQIEKAATEGYAAIIPSQLTTEPLEVTGYDEDETKRGITSIGVLVLPGSQIEQERILREELEREVSRAEEDGASISLGSVVDRKVKISQRVLEKMPQIEEWVKVAASSAEYQFAITDYPNNDKGISSLLFTLGKYFKDYEAKLRAEAG